MAGGGGFAGRIQNSLQNYLNQGFAIGATDTGHQANEMTADWALNNMERQLNFGKLAIHRTAVISKSILHQLYCATPTYSYFVGCSRGGGQGMMEAQYYAEDFDGIVAGAPAFSWPAWGAKLVQISQHNYPKGDLKKSALTNDNLRLLQEHVLQQCDQLDGVTDKILNDPRDCKFDFTKLPLCGGENPQPGCFTHAQLQVIKSVYSPLMVDQSTIYPGFPFGLEAESLSWDFWITGSSPMLQGSPGIHHVLASNIFKYLVFNDPSWDLAKYDFRNFADETRYASSYLDATLTDYTEFKKANGKMILYHGWSDPALSAFATIQHYEEALAKDKNLPSHIRLFLLPGVLHCDSGGTGPNKIDWVKQIQDWVEKDLAPDRLVFSKYQNDKVVMKRPVFPYPRISVYKGKGDVNNEQSFYAK